MIYLPAVQSYGTISHLYTFTTAGAYYYTERETVRKRDYEYENGYCVIPQMAVMKGSRR